MIRAVAVAVLACVALACSVEKLSPLKMVHKGDIAPPRRVVVLPIECQKSRTVEMAQDPRAWCDGINTMAVAELSFRGIEVVQLGALPISERTREEVQVSFSSVTEGTEMSRRTVKVTGPTYSEADAWTQRAAIAELGIEALVRIRVAHTESWPVRTFALARMTRPGDAALISASMCELETSRLDTDQEGAERAVRCALAGLAR